MDTKEKMEPEEKRCRIEQKPLPKYEKFPTVVDNRKEMLEFIYGRYGSRGLPLTNHILVHFDSHPDMVIPKNIEAASVENKDFLVDELNIENWIMPTVYAGKSIHLMWLNNSLCEQKPDVSEDKYCEEKTPESPKETKYDVKDVGKIVEQLQLDRYALEIDLDFFSTHNPFLHVYREANCFQQLRTIFKYDKTQTSLEASKQRLRQLEDLKAAFEFIDEHKSLESYENTAIAEDTFEALKALVVSMQEHYSVDEVEWSRVYDAGCTIDSCDLPNHVSTDNELREHYKQFKEFLEKLHCPPIIVTISRSSGDDYSPINQVAAIQSRIVEILIEYFSGLEYN